jgi:site-specific DNA recombinase
MEAKKPVGIWIRVSTEDQAQGDSPEHHEKRARMYAESKGWEVITVYHLEGVSGKAVMHHAEAKRMLEDIKKGSISGLIFSKLARLARSTKELLEFSDIFQEHKADLISLQESIDTSTPAGRLFYTVIAAMAQWEREEISSRVAASVPIRAKLGKSLGGQAVYGYAWKGNELVINDSEAQIRKLMYELFLKHRRLKSTAKELNELGHRTRKGSEFSTTTVERLLRDTTAKGFRRANYTQSLGEGKQWKIKPESEWVIIPCPAIVEEDLWSECNRLLEQMEKKEIKLGKKTQLLLAGFIHCHCGTKMYVYNYAPLYKCKACKNRIRVEDIDKIFYKRLKRFLLADEDIESYLNKSNTIIADKESLLARNRAECATLKKQMDEMVSMRISGDMPKDRFNEYFKPLEQRVRQMEDQLPELESEVDFLKINLLSADTVMRDAKNLYEYWPTMEAEDRRSIVEIITNRIVVGQKEIKISLSYIPSASQKAGNSTHNLKGS